MSGRCKWVMNVIYVGKARTGVGTYLAIKFYITARGALSNDYINAYERVWRRDR